VLETPRTFLTVLQTEQAPLLQAYTVRNRDHLAPWEPERDDHYYTLDAARDRIALNSKLYERRLALTLAALDRADGEMVGVCNFTNFVFGPFQACHLGFSIDARREGDNLMFEIAQAAISHVFATYDLHRIMANHMVGNTRSARLLARLGFEREGLARSYLKIAGRWEDHVLNSLLNPDHVAGAETPESGGDG
jgi:ribosomal-protein-alanine N-acetyltransferase